MLSVQRAKTISVLAFPVSIAQSSILVMSLIDLAMVGKLGNSTIAAVGLAVFSYNLISVFVAGIDTAVQGLVSRRIGQGSQEPMCLPLNGGILIVLLVGIPLTIICRLISPFIFSSLSSDPEVIRIGTPFLQILYAGIIAVGINSAFKGYWAGIEKTKIYMAIVLFMNCMKVLLNYMLIFGHFGAPALAAAGAAIATVSSVYTGVAINFGISYFYFRKDGFLHAKPAKPLLVRIVKIALPASVQGFFFSASYLVYLSLVGKVGTAELAAANVLIRITLMLMVVATSLGVAAATLVSKTVGEGNVTEADQWGWDSGKLGVIGITLLGLPLVLFPRLFLSVFLSDPHAITIALLPMRMMGATAGIASLIWIFAYTLYALGAGKRVALISLGMQWIFLLPLVWIVGPYLHYGLLEIWLVNTVNGALVAAFITAIFADGKWKKIRL
jgi:MATE family multidrug resistance protein